MAHSRWNLVLLGLAHSLNHSLFLVLPPLLDVIAGDLGASYQTIGSVATVSFLIYGVGSLIGGPLSNRVGEVKISAISVAAAGASSLLFLLPKSLDTFSAVTYMYALWASFYHPTVNTLISRLYPENTAGAMGLHGAIASLAQVVTPAVSYYLGTIYDWRVAYAVFGAASLLSGVLLLRLPQPERDMDASSSFMDLFRLRGLWVIIAFNVFIGLLQRGVELFFPAYLVNNRGFTGEAAALINSSLLLFAVLGQLAGGWAADKYTPRRALVAASAGIVAGMLSLVLLPWPIVGVGLFVLVFGFSFYGHQPTSTALLGRVTPAHLRGTAYGVMFFFAFGLGSVSATVSGFLADNYGLDATFQILSVFAFIAFVISVYLLKVLGGTREVSGGV